MLHLDPVLLELKERLVKELPRLDGKICRAGENKLALEAATGQKIPVEDDFVPFLMVGDRVSVVLSRAGLDSASIYEGNCKPERLIQPGQMACIARALRRNSRWMAAPGHSPWVFIPLTPDETGHTLQERDWLWIQIEVHPLLDKLNAQPSPKLRAGRARILQWIAHEKDPFLPWKLELTKAQLPVENHVPSEYDSLSPLQISDGLDSQRTDLTSLAFFTIDGSHTQDMDDALAVVEIDEQHFEVLVAISDVDGYVSDGSAIDEEAFRIGSSVYLPNFTVPMLPLEISCNTCSLAHGEVRAAVVLRIRCDKATYSPSDAPRFELAWIQSQAKLSYAVVSDYLEGVPSSDALLRPLKPALDYLWKFAKHQLMDRIEKSLVLPQRPEHTFTMNEQGEVCSIQQEARGPAHRLVEELMIFSNRSFTEYAKSHGGVGCLFMRHEGFQASHLPQVIRYLDRLGIATDLKRLQSLEGYIMVRRGLLAFSAQHDLAGLTCYQAPSKFSNVVMPHFSMALEGYATWTSPIRKYCDLTNLRWLKGQLTGISRLSSEISEERLEKLTAQRKKVRICQRSMVAVLHWKYLKRQLAEAKGKALLYSGRVTEVSQKGMMIYVEEIGLHVLLPIGKLCAQLGIKLIYQGQIKQWTCTDGQRLRGMGSPLVVQIERVSPHSSGIQIRYISGLGVRNQNALVTTPIQAKPSPIRSSRLPRSKTSHQASL